MTGRLYYNNNKIKVNKYVVHHKGNDVGLILKIRRSGSEIFEKCNNKGWKVDQSQ